MHDLVNRRRFLSIALRAAAVGAVSACAAVDASSAAVVRPRVGLLRSRTSLRVLGWSGAWEADGAAAVLRALGLEARELGDADLTREQLRSLDLLIVANARCVSPAAAGAVSEWVSAGGRLLATGMASYRTDRNTKAGSENNFQWAEIFGADFQRWIKAWPQCEFLELDESLATEVGVLLAGPPRKRIQLGRNAAMLVRPRPSATSLATWLQADGATPTTDSGSASAAIVQRDRVIYCGENLFAPELARSTEVMALILALAQRLLGRSTGRLPLGPATAMGTPPPSPTAVPVLPDGPLIRVGLDAAMERAGLASTGGLTIHGGAEPIHVSEGHKVEITVDGGGKLHLVCDSGERSVDGVVEVRPRDASQPLQLMHLRGNGTCRLQGFRGTLAFTARDKALHVVNIISIEEYVAGVVPNETPAVYPAEALRAMAVIARTFALSRKGYHRARGYDVCGTVDCQMYGGWLTETESTNHAVTDTRGEVVAFGGGPADTTFHAVCGGVGEDVSLVWPLPQTPYLVGAPDGPASLPDLSGDDAFAAFLEAPPTCSCASSPRFRWRETYTLTQLQTLFEHSLPVTLRGAYTPIGALRSVRVAERSPRGRVMRLEIEGAEGRCEVRSDRIRWLWSGGRVGQGGLQSTLFRICPRPDGAFDFVGGGWGHGVGMCQEGAAGMALRGLDHRAIIAHYYAHTDTVPLETLSPQTHAALRPRPETKLEVERR